MKTFLRVILIFFIISNTTLANVVFAEKIKKYTEPATDNSLNYRKLDDLLKELKDERKIIEQQRLQEIEQKRIEKEGETPKSIENNLPKDKVQPQAYEDHIPKLIVRLRGKHSTKYLCEYKFTLNNSDNNQELSKEIISDYTKLLKKPSLKVRPGEIINFEFTPQSNSIKAYVLNENLEDLKIRRGCITVPDLDKKIVVIIDGRFENGYTRYAIVLDIRKS